MTFRIEYTHRAVMELDAIIQYVIDEFGFSKGLEVRNDFRKTIKQIANNPATFPFFDQKRNIRKCVISFQTTLYYSVEENTINLLSFRSSWMNPKTTKI